MSYELNTLGLLCLWQCFFYEEPLTYYVASSTYNMLQIFWCSMSFVCNTIKSTFIGTSKTLFLVNEFKTMLKKHFWQFETYLFAQGSISCAVLLSRSCSLSLDSSRERGRVLICIETLYGLFVAKCWNMILLYENSKIWYFCHTT